MNELTGELQLVMNALTNKIERAVFVIDVRDIPIGMTAEEFAEQWMDNPGLGEVIYISPT